MVWFVAGLIFAMFIAFLRIFEQNDELLKLQKKLESLQEQLNQVAAKVYTENSATLSYPLPQADSLADSAANTDNNHSPNDSAIAHSTTETLPTRTGQPIIHVATNEAPTTQVALQANDMPANSFDDKQRQAVDYTQTFDYPKDVLNQNDSFNAAAHETEVQDENSTNVVTSLLQSAKQWFFGENLVVRVGAIVLLVGVVLLLKLASQYIHVSIPVRMALVALGGLILTGIGFKTTAKKRNYGLTLQGVGFAVIYLTVFTSFKRYGLLPETFTFGLLAILAGLTVMFSVWQNALPLAVLAFGGAFFAPILVSRPDGSVVMLFGYYLLLNVAVAVIAHYRTWKLLNALSLFITFGLAYLWGYHQFQNHVVNAHNDWQSVRWQLVGILMAHMALYIFIAVRYSQQIVQYNQNLTKQSPTNTPILSIDSGLLFGTALLGFGLMASLLNDLPYHLAFASSMLSAIYLGLGFWLLAHYRNSIADNVQATHQFNNSYQLLIEASLALGAGFMALVIPLALSAKWISIGWAIQGVGLVWLGQRTYRQWTVWLGLALQAISIVLLMGYDSIIQSWYHLLDNLSIPHQELASNVSNTLTLAVLTMVVLLSGFILRQGIHQTIKVLTNDPADPTNSARIKVDNKPVISTLLVVVGLGLYTATILSNNHLWNDSSTSLSLELAVAIAVFLLGGQWLHHKYHWHSLRQISRLSLPVAMLLWFWVYGSWFNIETTYSDVDYRITSVNGLGTALLGMLGCLAVAKLLGIWLIRRWTLEGLKTSKDQFFWLLTLIFMMTLMVVDLPYRYWHHDDEMQTLAWILPSVVSVLALIGWHFYAERKQLNIPLFGWLEPKTLLGSTSYILVPLTAIWVLYANYGLSGQLLGFYVPILNPLDLTIIGILLYVSFLTLNAKNHQGLAMVLVGLIFITISSMLVRSFASFFSTPIWTDGAWGVSEVQTGLTILWTILAMVLMFIANKKAIRMIWFAGMALLTLVVAKLILVDMSNTSAILRVVSFIGAGLLMLVIGYLAPLPPKREVKQ